MIETVIQTNAVARLRQYLEAKVWQLRDRPTSRGGFLTSFLHLRNST